MFCAPKILSTSASPVTCRGQALSHRGRIDALAAEVKAGFEQTQAAFDDHRQYAEFLTQGLRDDMSVRFNHMERRFDSVDERFDRLETLIKER